MKFSPFLCMRNGVRLFLMATCACMPAFAQHVTFLPYVQLGDNGPLGPTDQIVVAWQTDEASPDASAYSIEFRSDATSPRAVRPSARVVDNYLAADPSLPTIPGAYGPHSNYTAVLRGLRYDTEY